MTDRQYSGKVIDVMGYPKITSSSNPHVKDTVRLLQKQTGRNRTAFMIEGPHLVEMALKAGVRLREAFVTEDFIGNSLNRAMLNRVDKIFEVTDQVLRKISNTESPQGIAALAEYEPTVLDGLSLKSAPLLVVLDAVGDPGNMGTIIRTADAAGADAVIILPGSCDIYMPKVIRSTAGSIFNIPVVYSEAGSLSDWLKRRNIRLAITASESDMALYDTDLREAIAIAFGNEAHGVSSLVRQKADQLISIPIVGRAESLNVASSAAICLYEAVRQRTYA